MNHAAPLRIPVAPMTAVLGTLPPDDSQWCYEIKWDGHRAIAHLDAGSVRLHSRSGHEVTSAYPELAGLADACNATSAILDGELVVLDQHGRADFGALQRHARAATYVIFDVLAVDGRATVALPYEQRRHLLEHLVEPGPAWLVPASRRGGGAELFEAVAAQGVEGLIAKRHDSVYEIGTRSAAWRKIKVRRRVEVIVGGFTRGSGRRAETFGSLLVGLPGVAPLRFAGGVGTGFTDRQLRDWYRELQEIITERCPFEQVPAPIARHATWVEPRVTIEIELAEFTNDAQVRQASFVRRVG